MRDNQDFFFDALRKAVEPKIEICSECNEPLDIDHMICECGEHFQGYEMDGEYPDVCRNCWLEYLQSSYETARTERSLPW
jgi:hypothetical protein